MRPFDASTTPPAAAPLFLGVNPMNRLPLLVAVLVLGLSLPGGRSADADNQERILKLFVEEFVTLTPGKGTFPASFQMGSADGPASERPVHTIAFKYEFRLAKYEVTQELYQLLMNANPSRWKG